MEAAVARVGVFGSATGAQHKAGHAGARPVVGQAARDGVARAAMGAVDEGVAPAPVVNIEKLGKAGVANPHVGADGGGNRTFGARQDHEIPARVVGRNHLGLDGIHPRQRWRLAGEALRKGIHQRLAAFNLDLHPATIVAHPADKAERVGETIHKGPEAHSLDHATHAQAAGNTGRINNNQHGRFRLSRHVRHPAPLRGL